ncbi:hypothetical protein KUF71_025976 [Frankliniella fusca]|uniref:RNA-directed DNA polymerase n=1 Tax=Frankliniella fusca TaxID=407009 RepID=A0AAE1LEW8_9NEOP|nr:hypothetical protein KUF71_025976 [Frankliniella fusca]
MFLFDSNKNPKYRGNASSEVAKRISIYLIKETNAQGVVIETDKRQDYESVVREFDLLARDQKNLTTCRETFDSRNQKSGEPFANWLTDLKNLIQHCDYDTREESLLKDRIIRGTNDKRLSETLRGKPKLTLEEVIDVCKGVEASLKRGVNETVSINVEMIQAEAICSPTALQFRGNNKRRGRGGFRGGSKFNSGRISKNQGQRGGFRGRRPYSQRGGGRGRSQTSANKYQCRKCDRWHQAAQCPAYGKQCTNCSGWNHFAVVCTRDRSNSGGANNSHNQNNNKATGSAVEALQIMALTKFESSQVITSGETKHPRKEYTEVLKLDNQHFVKFKLDPGAEVNILPVKVFQIINRNYKVRQTNVMLRAFGQVITKAEGTVKLLTETKAGAIIVTEYILSSVDDRPILGIEDCERLNLIKRIHSVRSGSGLPESKDDFIKLYSEVFTGLGQFKQTVKILIDPSVKPGPLYELLSEKVSFQWLPIHSQAFKELKDCVSKAPALATFDPSKPIVVQADASQYGIGACILQSNLPVGFTSRLMTESEKDYAQVEKEMLALSFAATKFEHFIYGMPQVLFQTDHQPLVSVFKKPLYKITNNRLKKLRLKMLKFQPVVEYLPGKFMHIADMLSRQCIETPVQDDPEMVEIVHEVTKYVPVSDAIKQDIMTETEKDIGLKAVKNYYKQGWPNSREIALPEARPYWQLRNDLFVENGLVILEDRIVIPPSLRSKVLNRLHAAHLGIDKTKARARQAVYWPGLSNDIVTLLETCRICERHGSKNFKEPLIPHQIPELRFQKVSADILDIGGNNYLAVEDNLSKWLEIKKLSSKTSGAVIGALKSIFYTHGIPEIIYGDNNPLDSFACNEFAKNIGSKIVTSSPEYPRSNGLAEKGVNIAKKLLIKSKESGNNYLDALREYNNTPLSGMDVSPAQILMSRMCRTLVPVLKEKLKPKVVNVRPVLKRIQERVKIQHDRHARRRPVYFNPGDNVVVRRGKIWQKGVIERKHGAARSYYVKPLHGRTIRRNTFDLKRSKTKADNLDNGFIEPYDIDDYLVPYENNVPNVNVPKIPIVPKLREPVVVLERLSLKRTGDQILINTQSKHGRIVKPNPKYCNPNIFTY